jgi:hypothetical protein
MKRLIPIVLGLLLLGVAASAQDTRRQESRKAQLEKEIAVINKQLKDNAQSSSRALTDLSLVRRKISARQELIAESDREIHALDDSIRVKQKEIDRLQARHDTLSLYYNRRGPERLQEPTTAGSGTCTFFPARTSARPSAASGI